MPDGLAFELAPLSWPLPEVFAWLARIGDLPTAEMLRTFNCGIGMALVVAPERAAALADVLSAAGETAHPIGRIGQPEEIADLALYLASDESRWTNGAVMVIDGGAMINYV